MGFADDTAGDGKGGWTDQGGSNDLRVFPVGRRLYNDVIFDVIDPKTNNGKSCLVLSSNPAMKFKSSAVVPLTTSGKYLTLLHAAAFVMPLGLSIFSSAAVSSRIYAPYFSKSMFSLLVSKKLYFSNTPCTALANPAIP